MNIKRYAETGNGHGLWTRRLPTAVDIGTDIDTGMKNERNAHIHFGGRELTHTAKKCVLLKSDKMKIPFLSGASNLLGRK
jgi:hypothetical protein